MLMLVLVLVFIYLHNKHMHKDCKRKNWNSKPFTKQRWSTSITELRYKYVNDLIDNHKLMNKNYFEILNMLGKPDSIYNNKISYIVKYFNSDDSICMFQSISFLEINFNSNRKTTTIITIGYD